jgi:hypothetical protein
MSTWEVGLEDESSSQAKAIDKQVQAELVFVQVRNHPVLFYATPVVE